MMGPRKVLYEQVNPRWEVCVTLSSVGFQQASFVNSIATTKVIHYCIVYHVVMPQYEIFLYHNNHNILNEIFC